MADAVLSRDEALSAVWMVADILAEVQWIRELLEDGEEEEEDPEE